MEEWLQKARDEFGELLSKVKLHKAGVYDIEVADVLGVGSYMVQPEVAVVKDTKGRLWIISEESGPSRYDIKKGVKLRVRVH